MDPRKKTWELAQNDVAAALKFAKGIDDIWYRVQSLSKVAWHIKSKTEFLKVIRDALKSAKGLSEPNRRVSVSAWAVRAMTKRKDIEIGPVVDELLEAIEHEPNPVRRADALLKLFSAVYPKKEYRDLVLNPLLKACREMRSWKQPIILADIALILAEDDPIGAETILKMIESESGQRKARKQIDEGKWLGPYEFIPYYTKHWAEK